VGSTGSASKISLLQFFHDLIS